MKNKLILGITLLTSFLVWGCGSGKFEENYSGSLKDPDDNAIIDMDKSDMGKSAKPKWNKVKEFKATKTKDLEPFTVSSPQWKVRWNFKNVDKKAKKKKGEFFILLRNMKNEELEIVAQLDKPGAGEYISSREPGKYYFSVTSELPFEITVEELK